MSNPKVFDARIQLKTDTQTKWELIHTTFIPLSGELIIYAKDASHNYARLKVGDGTTTLQQLPFIDAGTISGRTLADAPVSMYANFNAFPAAGAQDQLYIDLNLDRIYYYDTTENKYVQLSNFNYTTTTSTASEIRTWDSGAAASFEVTDNCLEITTGRIPELTKYDLTVVTSVTRGE